jgi:hypothetical protein
MPQFVNFYENLAEAKIRLQDTVVLYDGKPYYVYFLYEDGNGKIKAYLDDYEGGRLIGQRENTFPNREGYNHSNYVSLINAWYETYKGRGLVRKEIGSPKFNKFRPFPLGNVNINGSVVYTERTPTRNTNQGLRDRSLFSLAVSPVPNLSSGLKRKGSSINEVSLSVYSKELYTTMLGIYPSAEEILEAFKDPSVINTGVAFNREFSIFRGPLGMLFLCYRNEGIGLLDQGDLSSVIIGRDYYFLKETIEELNCFSTIACK